MKRFLFATLIISFIVSCSSRDEIPSDVLEDIFEETALTTSAINSTNIVRDSIKNMNYYSPILEKYGYTVDDLEYTIDKMVARKSNILTQILRNAKEDIKNKYEAMEYLYLMHQNIDRLIMAYHVDTLYKFKTNYKLENNKNIDSSQLYLPLNGDGKYILKVYYTAKKLSKYKNYYINAQLQDSLYSNFGGVSKSAKYNHNSYAASKIYSSFINLSLNVKDDNYGNLLKLNLFSNHRDDGRPDNILKAKRNKKGKYPAAYYTKPDITIDSIIVTKKPYFLDAISEILIQANGFTVDYKLVENPKYYRSPDISSSIQFADTIKYYIQKKSGAEMVITNKDKNALDMPPEAPDFDN